jgi:mono/diheme cytochrome c family protein
VAPLGGVVVGVVVFLGVNFTIGHAIIPSPCSVMSKSCGLSEAVQPPSAMIAPPAPTGPYQTVCATCHQQEGQGMPGAFPPLAGSEWLLGNPEIPARIVVLGLSGPIEVEGKKFSSMMPPPPGLSDEQLADAISFARSHFGNHAGPITADLIKKVRASLAGRTTPWAAGELAAIQTGPGEAAPTAAPEAPSPAAPVAPTKAKAKKPATVAGAKAKPAAAAAGAPPAQTPAAP